MIRAILLSTIILTGCEGNSNREGDIAADGTLELLLFQCFGYCRASNTETIGIITSERQINRTSSP